MHCFHGWSFLTCCSLTCSKPRTTSLRRQDMFTITSKRPFPYGTGTSPLGSVPFLCRINGAFQHLPEVNHQIWASASPGPTAPCDTRSQIGSAQFCTISPNFLAVVRKDDPRRNRTCRAADCATDYTARPFFPCPRRPRGPFRTAPTASEGPPQGTPAPVPTSHLQRN